MGSRGPLPESARILSMRGSTLAAKRAAAESPLPAGRPEPPAGLQGKEREVWDAVCDHLDALGILSEIDGPAISVYSNLYARWSECAVCVQERGGTEEVKRRGATVWRERPEAKMARQLAAELRQWAPMFGLTPASRARLGIRPPPLRPTPGGPPSTRPNGGDIKSRVFGSHS